MVLVTAVMFVAVEGAGDPVEGKQECKGVEDLTPAQQYAAEVLSYLLKVVLGKTGNPRMREAWSTRGIDEELDLNMIKEIMTDSAKNELVLIVLDPNILNLTRVLYYYDERLSLHKRGFEFTKISPSPELVAVRLLLLKKIRRGEKIRLGALTKRRPMLTDKRRRATEADLEAMNLNADEMRLIKHILGEEPQFCGYLNSPFLVKALHDVGAVEEDAFAREKMREANYRQYRFVSSGGEEKADPVRISILPSVMGEFHYGDEVEGLSLSGFKPTRFLDDMIDKLKSEIVRKTKMLVSKKVDEGQVGTRMKGEDWEPLWSRIAGERISFHVMDERPLVIYPENAREVIRDTCASCDFNIILLDKNVYLSMYFAEETDLYSSADRIYMDIMDIEYGNVEEETDRISRFIFSKLEGDLDRMVEDRFNK